MKIKINELKRLIREAIQMHGSQAKNVSSQQAQLIDQLITRAEGLKALMRDHEATDFEGDQGSRLTITVKNALSSIDSMIKAIDKRN